MRLVVTGGGTGGHIYPALEVAKFARDRGAELLYLGSLRGQESAACDRLNILFQGFPSEPLYSLTTLRGVRALVKLQQSRRMAKRALKAAHPDVVFSTGGYSAGPVIAAARDLSIPYVLHSADSIPARSSRMFAKQCAAFTCIFRSTERFVTDHPVCRTGQPIRTQLRAAAANRIEGPLKVLVTGGSQGSQFLNESVPNAARIVKEIMPQVSFIHIAGRANQLNPNLDGYQVFPYLESQAMAEAMQSSTIVVARSGGTVAEIAMFGLPSVLVPLPSSANDHQLHNAEEFVEMKAATLVRQADASPDALATAMLMWLSDSDRRQHAKTQLQNWDIPDATERIFNIVNSSQREYR